MREAIRSRQVAGNKTTRVVFFSLGILFTLIGIIGFIVPLMPGTIFLFIAAYFFARSSERFLDVLLNNRFFGRYIHDFANGARMPRRAKVVTGILIAVSLTISLVVLIR